MNCLRLQVPSLKQKRQFSVNFFPEIKSKQCVLLMNKLRVIITIKLRSFIENLLGHILSKQTIN